MSHPIMSRCYYSAGITEFLAADPYAVLGELARGAELSLEAEQRDAWQAQIYLLRKALGGLRVQGRLYFEYIIPRMGRRIDLLAILGPVLFVLEFKVGEKQFLRADMDQVMDYALDLKNFHAHSHDVPIAPVLIATGTGKTSLQLPLQSAGDNVRRVACCTADDLASTLQQILDAATEPDLDPAHWETGGYHPTPTIIEAATALYRDHSVADIGSAMAEAANLSLTSDYVAQVVRGAQSERQKSICFITGVPGSGKTLAGLNIATQHMHREDALRSVFLSGNGPLVAVLREALARDHVSNARKLQQKLSKREAARSVDAFIQNVHHFRDECLKDATPPHEHVALFDEAQRAWTLDQTRNFMQRRKGVIGFNASEPEYLISCLDRHQDWAVIVCLVGGGQEINTGEAGIGEWLRALRLHYPEWHLYISGQLTDAEYAAEAELQQLDSDEMVHYDDRLHLAVSLRSFRAENLSRLVKQLLDLEAGVARETLQQLRGKYPICLTRDIDDARAWLREKARGTERSGLMVSSGAQRLKPLAIDVRAAVDPVHYFLDDKDDVRSSYYLEDAATEFQVQGLELDWAGVIWDGDFRMEGDRQAWQHWSFRGDRWNRMQSLERQKYLKNAYRVLLTRARQGMVIVVPSGSREDPTRNEAYYGPTFEYLEGLGLEKI